MNNQIKPVLVIYVSLFGINTTHTSEYLSETAKSLQNTINNDDYIVICVPTRKKEHKLELLNPNIVNTEEAKDYLLKLDEIRKVLTSFTKSLKELEPNDKPK